MYYIYSKPYDLEQQSIDKIDNIIQNILPNQEINISKHDMNKELMQLLNTILSYAPNDNSINYISINPRELDPEENHHIYSLMNKLPYLKPLQEVWILAITAPIGFTIRKIEPGIMITIKNEDEIEITDENTPNGYNFKTIEITDENTPIYFKFEAHAQSTGEHHSSLDINNDEYETLLSLIPPEAPYEDISYKKIHIPLNAHQAIIQAFAQKYTPEKTKVIRHFLENMKRLRRTEFISSND